MITRTEDLRPGRYRVRRLHTNDNWDEMMILSASPDVHGYLHFSLKSYRYGSVAYGLIGMGILGAATIHYPHLVPIPIEIQRIDIPEASISHVRRVEL